MKITLLVSGGLGYTILKDVYESKYELVAVFTNKTSSAIVDFCKKNNISFFAKNPRKGAANDFIKNINCDILLSVNYLYIVEKDLLQLPQQYAINLHGSLLPKYRGRTPHVWAIINGEKEAGVTAHLMTEGVDEGDILKQIKISISQNNTGAEILSEYQKIYPELVKVVLAKAVKGTLQPQVQDNSQATYFGKRTPEDGQINWDWSKERIRNWIRAQARPYPGAFTFYQNQKFSIHQAIFSSLGFNYDQPNGTLLSIDNQSLTVKTSNGALRLSELVNTEKITFVKNDCLQ
ncbi:MAG: methionyl-tRNA formyltransferase [Saprospiraceae bacterium]